MSDSHGEDGRREKSTTTTTTTTINSNTIITATTTAAATIIRENNIAMMGDDGPAATAVKRRSNDDAVAVGNRNDLARTRRDTDAPSDHGNGDARVFPAVAGYDPTGCGTTDQRVIDAFIRGARVADEDRRKSSLVSTDAFAKLYSAAAMDSQSRLGKESCSCDNTADYKAKRDMFREELQKAMNFQNLWTELRQYIRTDFNVALETAHIFESPESHHGRFTTNMHNTVMQLCKRDSHQLFMRLVSQAQEFVIEVKIRLFALLHDRSVNLAEIFLTGLLNDYDALVSTAILISELVKPLKKCLNFNLTWDCFIKKLYQIYVYNDALVQNNLPTFISQLRKLPLKGSKYQALVHRYIAFDDEMTRIGNLWPETEPWMDKYNAEQAVRMTRLRQIRDAWELFTTTRKLMERSMLNKTPDIGNEMQEIHGQFSSLIAHTSGSDSPPLSPVLDFSSDSITMPSSIEIVQILLDDWNKAQHQKLADIAGALTATEVDAADQGDSNYDYTRATCQLAQYAIRSVRSHNDDAGDTENGLENGKGCECHMCNDTGVDHTDVQCKDETVEKDETNSFPSLSNGFSEIPTSCTMMQLKEKLVNSNNEEKKKKDLGICDTLHKYTNSKISESEPCLCVYQHAQEIAERKKEILESPPCPCLLNSRRKWDICPCLPKSIPETVVTNGRPKATSPTSVVKANTESSQKPAVKTGSTQSAQTQTRHSTTQTHSMHQGNTHSHAHGPLPDLTKNTGPCSHPRLRPLNHTPHACHKQANVEHIKRMSCNDLSSGDGDCSDSGSSQEDSCSTSSSAQRDANVRHCDCCYCEVFGHGMSVAPVSRNYKEMRERLRQLLTKKKAKKCKTVVAECSPQKSPSESSISNTNSESKTVTNSILRSNTPILTPSTVQYNQRDQRDLEELLEFIEGNQSGKKDNKKAEKKARQKQRKLEEKLKKDRQEAERQKLIELQKKTPEVTITVVDPQKPVPQRLLPQCNLPEVSILPTSPSASLPTIKQQFNNRKKDKQEVCSNSNNNCGSNSITNLSNKTKTMSANSNVKNKSINSMEKCEVRNTSSSQGNKNNGKTDKIDSNKGSKPPASINITKNSPNNNANKLSDINLLDKKLTKKERKKLKKEMKKLEEAKTKETESAAHTESQPQIVTIRREINSNSAEPTVTITLKGQTPAEDKVLFTLVNGQTKEPSHKSEQEQNQCNNGKKKKVKANNNSNPLQQGNKLQQSNNSKQQIQIKASDGKNMKQQANNEKSKNGKQVDERKVQQQSINEGKNSKSKKDKRNTENKENVLQQQNSMNKSKNQQNMTNKKQNKTNTPPPTPVSQKQQQNQIIGETTTNKKVKKQQQQQDKNLQSNTSKSNKNNSTNANNKNVSNKSESQKTSNVNKINQTTISKQRASEVQNTCSERVSSPSLSSQFKDIGPNSKINIENLKLPPGITITKVDAPPKPIPIKTAPLPKPVNPPKQTTIIAAPMSGVQSSYANPQAGGNVIVVDTGKLKQDLLPKGNEKDSSQSQNTATGKKKKKKNKNSGNAGNNTTVASPVQNSDSTFASDHVMDEPARILHNPGTNMVTIRNPSFGPMKVPPTQQAAIIKVSENGMVTIRSPALQQAINAGLTSPPKPDYIVKGDLSSSPSSLVSRTTTTTTDCGQLSVKHANGVISSSLAELRSRLNAQPDCASSLSELANIQISQMTNGQSIPENGINLKGTSVTLTKVRSEASMEDTRQTSAKCAAVKETAINATSITTTNVYGGGNSSGGSGGSGSGSGKSKKKKKRGGGTGQCGDDLDLVEVFTPKDIDLDNDEEMDDDERELEAFKRFCQESIPPLHKEKVKLNIKDIVLKKKSSSSSSSSSSTSSSAAAAAATAVIAAN
ncbi:uncharacterized protein LOC105433514 isoform X2 [Pogonomyrmex barbatus]|uniref:Uncharacterized protein LOC105433514 isoform X2 n=1 Tax=Pogonomyrmex barbatus TaxID=144034 RepID=A0A6I9XMF1_9HYME|nr:uncharacterized protein LOC105433514 isoform X2 [Pogonomyrmex barbatus]